MHDYDAFLTLRALRRVMVDSVRITRPVTTDMLLVFFRCFDWSNPLYVCMHAAFLVAFFSFLRRSLIYCLITLRAESPSIFLDKSTYLGRSKETLLAG